MGEKIMKIIFRASLLVMLTIGVGCSTIGGLRSNLDNLKTDIHSTILIVRVLEQSELINHDEAIQAFKNITDASSLLELSEAALNIGDKVVANQHQEAVIAILIELGKYKNRYDVEVKEVQ